ncbi:Ig-like domain-containing protein [Thorsellia anophelis]|uniref:Bacterial Ig-like domain-containing protein n=1 Tax=Thorsellia anophelis DSM 18579 TaxID=1123402 RepID=A0A1I0DML1_9GAMM|nr:Ig-like domain-containing protein [Thorsellia anophelis]SET33094.1 hypothetical protein SAMN02583745_02037 [Thorsellia anophelis DSM 18579]
MSITKVIITSQTGKTKTVKIGKATSIKFKQGDTLLIGTEEFPYSLVNPNLTAVRKGDTLELAINAEENSILIIEDYFQTAVNGDISLISGVNEATTLMLANGESIITLSNNTFMGASVNGATHYIEVGQYESLAASFEIFDTTTLLTLGAAVAGIGVYALTSSSSEDENQSNSNNDLVFAPKELKATDISIVHVGDDDKFVSSAGKNGEINTLTPEIEGATNSASMGNEIVIELADGKTYTTTVQANGSWFYKFPKDVFKAGDKGVFKIYEQNSKGEKSKPIEVPFEIDLVKPTEFTKPILVGAADDGSVNTDKPTIKGEKAEPGAKVKILSPTGSTHFVDVDKDGKWTFTFPDLKMTEGQKKEITVTILDQAGNVGDETFTIPIIRDLTPPVAPKLSLTPATDDIGPIKGILSDANWTDDSKPVFTGTGEVGMTLLVYVDGQKLSVKTPITVDKNGQWIFEFETALTEGNRKIEFRLQDSAGNISQSSSPFYLNIDTVKLTKSVISEVYINSDGDTINNGEEVLSKTPVLIGNANSNIEKVILYQFDPKNGNGIELGEADVSYGKWSFHLNEDMLVNGLNNIKIIPVSKAGNDMLLEEAPNITFNYLKETIVLNSIALEDEFDLQLLNQNSYSQFVEPNPVSSYLSLEAQIQLDTLLFESVHTVDITSIERSSFSSDEVEHASEQSRELFSPAQVDSIYLDIDTQILQFYSLVD